MRHLAPAALPAAVLAITLTAALLAADSKPDKPLSPAALDALSALQAAKKRAQADYDAAVRTATARAVKALEQAKANAMKAADLQEANAIQASIDGIRSGAERSISGTRWLHTGAKTLITFNNDGTATCPSWKGLGHWAARDRSFAIDEPGGKMIDFLIAPDGRNALYIYKDDGHASLAIRQ